MSAVDARIDVAVAARRSWLLRGICVALAACIAVMAYTGAAMASAAAPGISVEQATGAVTSSIVEARIAPNGAATTCTVQYVSEAAFHAAGWTDAQSVACPETIAAGAGERWVFVHVGGLTIETSYEYRVVASNSAGTTEGPEAAFVTFGLETFSFEALGVPSIGSEEELVPGEPFALAGGHPYELVTSFVLNSNMGTYGTGEKGEAVRTVATLKDVKVHLPVGVIGNPTATPRCSLRAVEEHDCRGEDQVGMMEVATNEKSGKYGVNENNPLFNVVPPRGVAARFSAKFNGFVNATIDAHVRTGSDYGIDADSLDITSLGSPAEVVVRMWGVPSDPTHTPERVCEKDGTLKYSEECSFPAELPKKPFLTMPTACRGPVTALGEADAFQDPGDYAVGRQQMPQTTGCEHVPFAPTIEAQPSNTQGDSPTGMDIKLHVPQDEEPEGTATSDLKDATVTFPAGVAVNPSSADGLAACNEEQVGFSGFAELDPAGEPGLKTAQFTPNAAECPEASEIGTVTIHTPLLEHPITGAMYVATPHQNPFGTLVAVYLTVYDPISGVVIKLPGKVTLDQKTGQITTTFEQTPQLPFEDLEVQLFGAKEAAAKSRAPLTTPETCGSYAATSLLEPWSHLGAEGEEGTANATPASEAFHVTSEPGGGACPATEAQAPNAPGFEAGTASPIGGAYSPFVLKLRREDGSQRFDALDVTLPPGMTGKVAGVEECPQADIEAAEALSGEGGGETERAHPSCPAGSEVGVAHVGAGSGAPFYVNGKAYFAGPYKGAPFSVVFITPAVAGPFDLGTVVVRAALYIDPHTAQVSVKSDPFPTILDGIPLDIRSVGVEMSRPEFTLNPTSCDVMSVGGGVQSTAGQSAALSDRFQVGGCDTMPFTPTFTASTQARHSRREGAYLHVRVTSGAGQANIGQVHVAIPRKMPARNDTLKLACTEAQFDKDPEGCPEGSIVGHAVAHTPILPVPLEGPAMFVSHGDRGFPDLEVVLKGDGVTVILEGSTFINKKGVTFSTFGSVPDVPVSSFDLYLPEGPHSALAANGNLCRRTVTKRKRVRIYVKAHRRHGKLIKGHWAHRTRTVSRNVPVDLRMPTTITGQNGAQITQRTKIAVHGCKPELRVLGKHVKGTHARLEVSVPSKGTLVAVGKGVARSVKDVGSAATVTISVKLSRRDRRVLAKHPHQRFNANVSLRFSPEHGAKLHAHVHLLMR